jgi:capsular polysaccharide biosynthesis protein
VFAIIGMVLALVISLVQPLKYSSTARLLVLQDLGTGSDAYTASRSEERIAENLSTIIYSTDFFEKVLTSGFDINENIFPTDDYRRRRLWGRTIDAYVASGSGLLTIAAYHQDVAQAEEIVRAVAAVLIDNADTYTSGSAVEIRLIDTPLNSRWPVKPNVLANGFSGLVLGSLVGIGYVLLQAERIRRRHQLAHEDFA